MSRKRKKEVEKLRKQAAKQAADFSAIAQERAGRLSRQTMDLAEQGKDWATPRVEAAVDWAAPKVQGAYDWAAPKADKAWRKTVKSTAPRIEKATAAVRPVVDDAYGKLADDYLPRVQKAMHDAAQAASKADGVKAKGKKAGKAARGALTKPTKTNRGRKAFGWVVVGTVAAGAGYLLWRRSQPVDDPWAEEYWNDSTSGPTSSSAAERLSAAAGAAKEKTTEVAGKVSETVKEKAAEVKDKAGEVTAEAKDAAAQARHTAEGKADAAKDKAAGAAEAAAEKAEEAAGQAKDAAQENKES